jgi:hypothetical protein
MRANLCNTRNEYVRKRFSAFRKKILESPRSNSGWWRLSTVVRLQAPCPFGRHLGLGDYLGLGSHIGSTEPEGGDPGSIKPPAHLADLVIATLQRKNTTRDDGACYVVRREFSVPLQDPNILDNPVGLVVAVLRVELPVGSGRSAGKICRKVDEINWPKVSDVKESLLPSPAGLQAGRSVEGAPWRGVIMHAPHCTTGFGRGRSGSWIELNGRL